jgi:hypothetical protein
MPSSRLRSIVFDCAHPAALARFWAGALGYAVRPYGEEEIARLQALGHDVESDPSVVIDPPGDGPTIWFNLVPEGKTVKNRVHIDVNLASADEIDRLVSQGARILRPLGAVPDERWAIMADPEGNEFCAFPPGDGEGDGSVP